MRYDMISQAAALMVHVREVLARHGLSLGGAHLLVRYIGHYMEHYMVQQYMVHYMVHYMVLPISVNNMDALMPITMQVRVRGGIFAEGLTIKGLRPPPARHSLLLRVSP